MDPSIWHDMNITEPVQAALLQLDVYVGYLSLVGEFGIGNVISPLDVQDAYQITKMKDVETSLLSRIELPCLSVIKYHYKDACLIDSSFGVYSHCLCFLRLSL